jgi:gas vesicle protein
MDEDREDNSRLGWFLAGAAIGAAVAILYAPKSGRDTRKYLGESTKDGREAMEASGRELMDRGKEIYERGKQIAEDAADLFERGRRLVQG